MDLTPFDDYPESFKEDLKYQVLEVLRPYTKSKKEKILGSYMYSLPEDNEIYWWNREAFFYILRGHRDLFTHVIVSRFAGYDQSPSTVTEVHKLEKILKHPEIAVKEVTES